MNATLRIFLFIVIIIFMAIILQLLRKRKLNLKYSLLWIFSGICLLVLLIFPQIIYAICGFVGIETPVNVVYVIEAIFILMILLSLTTIISSMSDNIRRLIQTTALLEKRVRELEEKLKEK